ncbi:MAG: VOC family protein [Thermoleophilia bacterium]|nr:VOC family protein [Thermoleophilia bacterium]
MATTAAKTSGVHHVALGVSDLGAMKAFYHDLMGFTEVLAEFGESEQEIMRDVTRSPCAVFSGALLRQKAGGISLELIHMVEPVPRPIRKDIRYGDVGVAKITVAAASARSVYETLRDRVGFCSQPKTTVIPGFGEYEFVHCRDPEGNLIEIVSSHAASEGMFGGVRSVGIAVTDLERSVSFYRNDLGFDAVVMDTHEAFSGLLDEVSGAAGTRVRSCLLSVGTREDGMLELFETQNPRGRSIPFSTRWGDFGYLQVAFDCEDIGGMAEDMEEAGMDLLCSPKAMAESVPDDPGEFVYVRDPDGVPIEFLFLPE